MARFLILWRSSTAWPTDPVESSRLSEKMWAAIDDLIKKGVVKEMGWFLDGASGYTIGEGEAADTFRNVSMFSPFIECEVHEVIPYEKAKESLRAVWKALAARK